METHRHLGPLGWTLYAVAPAVDAGGGHPTWLSAVAVVAALGGLVCHVIQTRIRVREYLDKRDLRSTPIKPFVPRFHNPASGD